MRSRADSKVGKLPLKKNIYYFWLGWVFVSSRAFLFYFYHETVYYYYLPLYLLIEG